MNTYFHSVRLDEEKCMGCTNCIKRCPTQAIRVRNGKAHIISERCIDCGECIRVCPHHAKYSHRDSMNRIIEFKYRVALPAPSLYGQFNHLDDIGYVITALKRLGFDEVFEVARGAELISDATRKYIAEHDIPEQVFEYLHVHLDIPHHLHSCKYPMYSMCFLPCHLSQALRMPAVVLHIPAKERLLLCRLEIPIPAIQLHSGRILGM